MNEIEVSFFGEDIVLKGRAEVSFRPRGMTLEIWDEEGFHYLIPGSLVEGRHYYAGEDSERTPGKQPVAARWAHVGDRFVGLWIEDGFGECLFTFPHSHGRSR